MPTRSPEPMSDLPSASELRASFLGPTEEDELARWRRFPATGGAAPAPAPGPHRAVPAPPPRPAAAVRTSRAAAAEVTSAPPSPEEVLSSSPAVVRLCESYHRSLITMIQRSRRQRVGILTLVGALGVGAIILSRSGTVTTQLVSDLVLAAAGSSAASLGLLALLWMRDQRQLRAVQGQRLLRALQSNCSLPPERIDVLRHDREPVATFFDCYSLWRSHHTEPRSRLGRMVATFRGTNHPSHA